MPPPIKPGLISINPSVPSDPQLREVVNDVVASVKLSLAAVAAETEPSAGATGKLDHQFRAFLAKQKQATRTRIAERARAMFASPSQATQHFGRYASITPAKYKTIGSDKLATV